MEEKLKNESIETEMESKVGDEEEEQPSLAASVAAPKAVNLKRRSSVGQSIRRSQSNNSGLTFEDQLMLLVGNKAMTLNERITKMVNLSVTATCRSLLRENDKVVTLPPVGSKEERQAELVDSLASSVGQKELLDTNQVKDISLAVDSMKASKAINDSNGSNKPPQLMSSRLRQLKQYVSTLKEEKDAWDDLFKSRKTKFNLVRSERQAVVKGTKCISNEDRERLSEHEDAWLRGISDGSGELERLQRQSEDLDIARRKLSDKVARSQKILDDKRAKIESMVKRIEEISRAKVLGQGDSDHTSSLMSELKESLTSSKADTEFGAEVKAWIADMQPTTSST